MMVGNAWKASMNPRDSTPFSSTCPGPSASRPKTNRDPSPAESRIFTTTSLTTRKTLAPAGTTKMNRATSSCRPIPHPITRQFMFRRSADRTQATPMRTKMPAKLIRL